VAKTGDTPQKVGVSGWTLKAGVRIVAGRHGTSRRKIALSQNGTPGVEATASVANWRATSKRLRTWLRTSAVRTGRSVVTCGAVAAPSPFLGTLETQAASRTRAYWSQNPAIADLMSSFVKFCTPAMAATT